MIKAPDSFFNGPESIVVVLFPVSLLLFVSGTIPESVFSIDVSDLISSASLSWVNVRSVLPLQAKENMEMAKVISNELKLGIGAFRSFGFGF